LNDALGKLVVRLGLSDDEVLSIFRLDPLAAIAGEHEHRPEIEILDALTGEADELVGAVALRRWLRSSASTPTPLERLERADFAGFEAALADWLRDSGVAAPG
jgi:hypothetical protein